VHIVIFTPRTRSSLEIIKNEPQRRDHLNELIEYFHKCCSQNNIVTTDSNTAIQPIMVGDSKTALKISAQLLRAGILVPAIRPPTVPANSARLRITFCANHTKSHVDQLISELKNISVNS